MDVMTALPPHDTDNDERVYFWRTAQEPASIVVLVAGQVLANVAPVDCISLPSMLVEAIAQLDADERLSREQPLWI